MTTDVTIIIVTHNSEAVIRDLLESIPAALGGLSARVTVVDNASNDGTRSVLASIPNISVVHEANRGYAAGLNAGVRASPPDSSAILILNPDVVLRPNSVALMFEMLRLPSVGIVAPRMVDRNGRFTPSLRRRPTIPRAMGLSFTGLPVFSERILLRSTYRDPLDVDWATGAALLIRRSCYSELDGWDQSFFLYSEETEFCLRAKAHGWRIEYARNADVVHTEGGSGRNASTESMLALNQVRLYDRGHSRQAAWVYFSLVVLAAASRTLRGRANARQVLGALLHRDQRPTELRLADSILPQDTATPFDGLPFRSPNTAPVGISPGGAKVAGVVIPAHNEERTICRLLNQLVAPDLDITVVSNGSKDSTAEAVRSLFPQVSVLESEKPSKASALGIGDKANHTLPRIFIDADVEISAKDVRALVDALSGPVLAAAPIRDIPRGRSSVLVSWYYDIWERLSQVQGGLFGRGAIALSKEGLERVRELPQMMSDDLVISEAFTESERTIVKAARVTIWPPRTIRDLLRRKIRSLTGNHQAQEAGLTGTEAATSTLDLWRIVLSNPLNIPKVTLFAGIWLIARIGAYQAIRSRDYTTWRRDDSSRA